MLRAQRHLRRPSRSSVRSTRQVALRASHSSDHRGSSAIETRRKRVEPNGGCMLAGARATWRAASETVYAGRVGPRHSQLLIPFRVPRPALQGNVSVVTSVEFRKAALRDENHASSRS